MKNITEYFADKNIIFKSFEEIAPKKLNSRKRIQIFDATTVSKEYYAIFTLTSKSRFLRKNAEELIELLNKLIDLKGHNYKKRYLLINSPICSKAKAYFHDQKWSVEVDFM